MVNTSLIPVYDIGLNEIIDGVVIKSPIYCQRCLRDNKKKCVDFYASLRSLPFDEILNCPYGFNVYLHKINEELICFSGVRVRGFYNVAKVNLKISSDDNNTVVNKSTLIEYIKFYDDYYKQKKSFDTIKGFVNECFHEVRAFNAHISQAEEGLRNKGVVKGEEGMAKLRNIQAYCSFTSLRLSTFDVIYNESNLKIGEKTKFSLENIFNKSKYCLTNMAKKKNVFIKVRAHTYCTIYAYDSIEMLPFILLENAVKYSPDGDTISVDICYEKFYYKVIIASIGPLIKKEERDVIFMRGARANNAKKTCKEGKGLGLFIVKAICDVHNASIINISDNSIVKTIKNVDYGNFILEIIFSKDE